MKNKIVLLLAVIMIFSSLAIGAASNIGIVINGEIIETDTKPINVGSRVLVPLRGILDKLGADVFWDASSREVLAVNGPTIVKLKIDSNVAQIGDRQLNLDRAPIIRSNRTYVPIRFLAESFGYQVDWKDNNVVINSSSTNSVVTPSNKLAAKNSELAKEIFLDMTESELVNIMGTPDRIDAALKGKSFIYFNGENTLRNYIRIGVDEGKVINFMTNAPNWDFGDGIAVGMPASTLDTNVFVRGKYDAVGYFSNGIKCVYIDKFTDTVMAVEYRNKNKTIGLLKDLPELRLSWELQSLELVNVERSKNSLPLLKWDDEAASIAREHSNDMINRQYFSHTTPDGIAFKQRAASLNQYGIGENISTNAIDPMMVIAGFTNSKTHRDNLRNASWKSGGIGISITDDVSMTIRVAFDQIYSGK